MPAAARRLLNNTRHSKARSRHQVCAPSPSAESALKPFSAGLFQTPDLKASIHLECARALCVWGERQTHQEAPARSRRPSRVALSLGRAPQSLMVVSQMRLMRVIPTDRSTLFKSRAVSDRRGNVERSHGAIGMPHTHHLDKHLSSASKTKKGRRRAHQHADRRPHLPRLGRRPGRPGGAAGVRVEGGLFVCLLVLRACVVFSLCVCVRVCRKGGV